MSISRRTKILAVSLIGLVFFCWLCTVVIPIIGVELSYQFKKNWRALAWPQFRVDLTASTFTTDGIAIPSIFIDKPVIYNVDATNTSQYKAALLTGIAHAAGTAIPGQGKLGYYFAHSSSPSLIRKYNAVFYLLGKLNTGDEIYIWHHGERFDYQVTDIQITKPEDISFLIKSYPAETIVLQTCWPPGTTLERLLVFAQKIP